MIVQGGLAKLLNLLRATQVSLHAMGAAADLKTEKQVAYHAVHALRVYMRVHLVSHVAALRQHRLNSASAQVSFTSLRVYTAFILPAYVLPDGIQCYSCTMFRRETCHAVLRGYGARAMGY